MVCTLVLGGSCGSASRVDAKPDSITLGFEDSTFAYLRQEFPLLREMCGGVMRVVQSVKRVSQDRFHNEELEAANYGNKYVEWDFG